MSADVNNPEAILVWAAARFAPRIAFGTGFGVEGCALIHMIATRRLPIEVFTLDTGLLFPETYALWKALEQRYGITIRAVHPEQTVAQQAHAHGEHLWKRDPERCCRLRKVEPLHRALAGYDAWISAIRRDQTRERSTSRAVEQDPLVGVVKVNPLIAWSTADVWEYVRKHAVPFNPLHERGYPSIGCQPCTTPVAAGEDPRAGRWRGMAKNECGLHGRKEVLQMTANETLVTPHGGRLVDRIVEAADVSRFTEEARTLTRIVLDAREIADLELIATGAASPLTGFVGQLDYQSILKDTRLASGLVWPIPLTLGITDEVRAALEGASQAALYDSAGRLWGTIKIAEVYPRDAHVEAGAIYGTTSPDHPSVAYLLSRPAWLLAGDVKVLPLPADLPFARHRLTPTALRQEIGTRGWRTVAAFQTRNPIHRAHEHLTKLALEQTDGLVIHPLVGETKGDDVPAATRFEVYEMLIEKYYPKTRTLLAAFPAAMRYAGPREALFHALIRKNYGITHFIVGRDHAGVGKFYGPLDAQKIFDRFGATELGVTPLRFDPTFYCKACGNLASSRTCPHDASSRLELSGTRVRELLAANGELPPEFTRPETAAILSAAYKRAARPSGFILWFTGLSGAGKSTLAEAVRKQIAINIPVEILDGDEVRQYLSLGLGFSKNDRDTNVRRIGYVARLLAKNGVGVITAAISPYRETRDEVRKLARDAGIHFVEVHVAAELDTLVARDVKGLYKKALAGEIQHFTGVSDPYEAPENPDLVVRTDGEPVVRSVSQILAVLKGRGLINAVREQLA